MNRFREPEPTRDYMYQSDAGKTLHATIRRNGVVGISVRDPGCTGFSQLLDIGMTVGDLRAFALWALEETGGAGE
jgi:hypothetical protein